MNAAPTHNQDNAARRPYLVFYGDDFTGSTDALEALNRFGLRAALFTTPPTADELKARGPLDAFGIAGTSRVMSPVQMEQELKPILKTIRAYGAAITHYKTCSTFDSSPEKGSVGKVMEMAKPLFPRHAMPVILGAPFLGRYVAFGNLFAMEKTSGEIHRLDRHPTMSRHPVTPMQEADIAAHLAKQTALTVGKLTYLDIIELSRKKFKELCEELDAVVIDVLNEDHLRAIGLLLIDDSQSNAGVFAIGSSGVEWAVAYGLANGPIPESRRQAPNVSEVDKLLVVSGSCSPLSASQIDAVLEANYCEVIVSPAKLIDDTQAAHEIDRATSEAVLALRDGKSVVLHTAKGLHDPRTSEVEQLKNSSGSAASTECISQKTAEIVRSIVELVPLRRLVIAGGDTSSMAAQALGIKAIDFIASIAPGGPLCRVSAPGEAIDQCEVAFKGGQVGLRSFYEDVRIGNVHNF